MDPMLAPWILLSGIMAKSPSAESNAQLSNIGIDAKTLYAARFHRVLFIRWRHLPNTSLYQPIDNQIHIKQKSYNFIVGTVLADGQELYVAKCVVKHLLLVCLFVRFCAEKMHQCLSASAVFPTQNRTN